MAPLQGIRGLYSDPQDTQDTMDMGVLEAKANAPDPEHGTYGSHALGYQGIDPSVNPYSGFPVYDGYSEQDASVYGHREFPVTGRETDVTPDSHAAPYPRGIMQMSWENPNGLALAGTQLRELHGTDLGGPELLVMGATAGREEPSHYTTDRYTAPNENYLALEVPGQLKGTGFDAGRGGYGGGNADPTQGYGVLNTLEEFQAGHSIRRVQHDTVHFDYTNTHGEQDVPFYGRHPVQQMPLDGPDSPYYEMGSIDGANIPWEGRIGYPTPYVQPAEPTITTAAPGTDVWAWG